MANRKIKTVNAVIRTLAILSAVCLVSCGHSRPMRVLSDIESIMDTNPQTARARLDSIDAGTLTGQPLALYAILKTQADYKCYVDIPDDSLIRIATDWYGMLSQTPCIT